MYQIVVPRGYQSNVFTLADDSYMGGYLGINKSYNRIINCQTFLKLVIFIKKQIIKIPTAQTHLSI